ncbi:MAG: 30S ribosomal protein S6 [Tenericutes bacterium]|nr:30S ribosomal protein S6 [Mycoplasmatota bacterium]
MKYEIMYIVRPDLEESAVKEVSKSFEKILTDNGAKVTSSKDLGQKELAYEIKNHKTGFYFLVNIEANDSKAIDEFNRLALISEDVIRHLIVKEEK